MDTLNEFWHCLACRVGREESVSQQLSRNFDLQVFSAKDAAIGKDGD